MVGIYIVIYKQKYLANYFQIKFINLEYVLKNTVDKELHIYK